VLDGARLALTTLTVLPVRAGRIDRASARNAMVLAPLVGAMLGGTLAAVAFGLVKAGLSPLPIAAVLVVLLALLTRGMHLDGLADTIDALGSYRSRESALRIMKSPEAGPMGVTAIVGVMLLDAAALTVLVSYRAWFAIAIGVAVGRLAISFGCLRGVPSARPDGLGATVAGTVPMGVVVLWTVLLAAAGAASIDRPWVGALAVFAALSTGVTVMRHATARLGGITGDVLGALCEIGSAVALVALSIR